MVCDAMPSGVLLNLLVSQAELKKCDVNYPKRILLPRTEALFWRRLSRALQGSKTQEQHTNGLSFLSPAWPHPLAMKGPTL